MVYHTPYAAEVLDQSPSMKATAFVAPKAGQPTAGLSKRKIHMARGAKKSYRQPSFGTSENCGNETSGNRNFGSLTHYSAISRGGSLSPSLVTKNGSILHPSRSTIHKCVNELWP
eukprot:scaffold597_cov176-Amphora_coffeaeformis.AAC.3